MQWRIQKSPPCPLQPANRSFPTFSHWIYFEFYRQNQYANSKTEKTLGSRLYLKQLYQYNITQKPLYAIYWAPQSYLDMVKYPTLIPDFSGIWWPRIKRTNVLFTEYIREYFPQGGEAATSPGPKLWACVVSHICLIIYNFKLFLVHFS